MISSNRLDGVEYLKENDSKVLVRLTRKCGFPEVTKFRALRLTYAMHLMKSSKGLRVAQGQSAHADARTTMKYSETTMERKKKATDELDYGLGKRNSGC